MQTSQVRTGNLILAKGGDQPSVFVKFFCRFRGNLFPRADDRIAARYRGMGWGDATELQLTNEIMTGGRSRS